MIRARSLVLAAALAACSAQPIRAPPAAALPTGRALPPEPPAAAARLDAPHRNAACEACHRDIAIEWRASGHRISFTDPVYQRALAREPVPFCRGCHAPEAPAEVPPPAELAALGVGCVTCHAGPHRVPRAAPLGPAAACAGCHEFAFPDSALRRGVDLMQSTLTEHAASPRRATPCAECHMPRVEGGGAPHRSHRFEVAPAMLRSAVQVSTQRMTERTLRLVLAPGEAGHAFPTGDLFRRLRVSARVIPAEGEADPAPESVRFLARHFRVGARDGALLRILVADDRVGGREAPTGTAIVDLELPPSAAGRPVGWQIAYQRLEHPGTEGGEDHAALAEITLLAEGTAPPLSKARP